MKINQELKENLITDVENICEVILDDETKEDLMRAFEITIGVAIKALQQPPVSGWHLISENPPIENDYIELKWINGLTSKRHWTDLINHETSIAPVYWRACNNRLAIYVVATHELKNLV